MALLLYLSVAGAVLLFWRRAMQPIAIPVLLAIALIPLWFTGSAVLRGRVYAPIDIPFATEPLRDHAVDFGVEVPAHNGTISDLYMQMIPWQGAVRRAFAAGEAPLWNPHILSGTVLSANMQSAPWDPVQLVGLMLDHPDALSFGATMTFFLAVLFTFAFARSLGCGDLASLIGASGYAFGAMLSFFVQWPLGRAWVYLPLVFFAVRLVVRECNLRAAATLTAAFVLMILTGHPESLLHIVSCGVAWGIFELRTVPAGQRVRAIALAAGCGGLALLLTAFSLLPFLEAVRATLEYVIRRQYYATADLNIPAGAVLDRVASSLFPFFSGPGQWRPVAGHWEPTTLRTGSVLLLLALLGSLQVRRKDGWFFAGLALFAGLVGLNAWPAAEFLHDLPLFDIAVNERLAIAAVFAIAMLAALTADAWPDASAGARGAAIAVAVSGILLAAGSAILLGPALEGGVETRTATRLIATDLAPVAIMTALLLLRVRRRAALVVLLAILLVQRRVEDGATYPALEKRSFYPENPILRTIRSDPARPFRIAPLHYALVPGTAALYGLEDVRGYEAMTLYGYFELYGLWCEYRPVSFNVVTDWSQPFLSFLNVKYAIASRTQEPDHQWKLIAEDGQSRLFENRRVLPRAFIPSRITYVRDFTTAWSAAKLTTDFGSVAWITAPEYDPHEIDNGSGSVRVVGSSRGELLLDVVMQSDGWIVTSETAWPGWRAWVDGRRVRPKKANHAFLGVWVPAGRHEVRLRYLPESFTRGRAISAGVLALLATGLLARGLHRRRAAISPA